VCFDPADTRFLSSPFGKYKPAISSHGERLCRHLCLISRSLFIHFMHTIALSNKQCDPRVCNPLLFPIPDVAATFRIYITQKCLEHPTEYGWSLIKIHRHVVHNASVLSSILGRSFETLNLDCAAELSLPIYILHRLKQAI
jgi:hypothetical protein